MFGQETTASKDVTTGAKGPLMAEIKERLTRIYEVVSSNKTTLEKVRCRVLGPWAEAVEDPGGSNDRAPGSAGEEVLNMLDTILVEANFGANHAYALNESI